MSFTSNLLKFCKKNTALIAGGGIIVGIHWMWYKIQQVPEFVPEHQRKDMPIIILMKAIKSDITTRFSNKTKEQKEDQLPPPTSK